MPDGSEEESAITGSGLTLQSGRSKPERTRPGTHLELIRLGSQWTIRRERRYDTSRNYSDSDGHCDVGIVGLQRGEVAAKVQQDVAKATDKAADSDAKAADKLASADASADKNVGEAQAKADEKTTDAAGDAVVTQAEGDHKVAVAQCESLSGQAQKDCKKQADDQLDAVKAKVKQLKKDAG